MIPKKTTKMIVKDGNGDYLQLLPETYTDSALNANSSDPISNSAVTSALNATAERVAELSLFKLMDEEPTTLNTEGTADKAIFAWIPPESWSITIDTEAKTAGSKIGEISLIFNPNDEASQNASMTVDWGDGTVVTYTPETACGYTCPQHEYAVAGIYDVLIESNDFDKLYMEGQLTDEGHFYGPEIYLTTLKRINNALPKIKGMHFYYDNDYVSTEDFDGSGGSNGNIDYGFFCGCESLESIPEDLFINNTNITNFYCFFCECRSLQSIPSGLFDKNAAVTSFNACFNGCTSLQSIPSGLFDNNTAVTDFQSCFGRCSSLQSIPSGLFDNNTAVTSFYDCFYNCTSLQSIPAGLFDKNTAVTSFQACFYNCSSLQSIPEGLFDNHVEVTNFGGCFSGCTSLQSIPSGLFDKNTAVTDFGSCFSGCTSLQSIPSGLFNKNTRVIYFYRCFYNCTSLQSIPSGLFDNFTVVTNFSSCFSDCTSLQSIPSGLFDSNTAVTNFSSCFSGCTSLQSIPSGLFDSNTAVTNFINCFYNCTTLTNFTLHIGSSSVSSCNNFVTKKTGTTRTIYVPSGSTTQTRFNAQASTLGLTIIGE